MVKYVVNYSINKLWARFKVNNEISKLAGLVYWSDGLSRDTQT